MPRTRTRKTRPRRKVLVARLTWVGLGLLAALIVASIALLATTSLVEDRIRTIVLATTEEKIEGRIHMGDLEIQYLPLRVAIHDVRVEHQTRGAFLEADAIEMTVDVISLFTDEIRISEVALVRPHVFLEVEEGRIVNLPGLVKQGGGKKIVLESLNVSNGIVLARLVKTAPWPVEVRMSNINVDVTGDDNELFEVRTLAGSGEVEVGSVVRPLDKLDLRATIDLRKGDLVVNMKHADLEMLDVGIALKEGVLALDAQHRVTAKSEFKAGTPLSIVSTLVSSIPELEGVGECEGSASLEGPDYKVEALCSGRSILVRKKLVGDIDARVSLDPSMVGLRGASLRQAGGELRFDASLALASERLDVEFKGEADGIRFADLVTNIGLKSSFVEFTASGPVEMAGTLKPIDVQGQLDWVVEDFRVGTADFRVGLGEEVLRLEPVRLRSALSATASDFTFKNALATSGSTSLRTTTKLGFDKTLDIVVDSTHFNGHDIPNLAGLDLEGSGKLRATVKGPMKAPVVKAKIDLKGTKLAGLDLGTVKGSLLADVKKRTIELSDVSGATGGSTYLMPTGRVEFRPRARGGILIAGNIVGNDVHLHDVMKVFAISGGLYGATEGTLVGTAYFSFEPFSKNRRLVIDGEGDVSDLTMYGESLGTGHVSGAWDTGRLEIREVRLAGGAAGVEVSGLLDPDEGLDIDLHIRDLDSGKVRTVDLAAMGLRFDADIDAHMGGTTSSPAIEGGLLTLEGTTYKGDQLGNSAIGIDLSDGILTLDGPLVGGRLYLRSSTSTAERWHTDVAVEASDLVLGKGPLMLDDLDEASAAFSGTIEASLMLSGGFEATGRISLTSAVLDLPEYSLANDGALEARFDESTLTLDSVNLMGEGTRIEVSGSVGKPGPRLSVTGQADLALLSRFVDTIDSAKGTLYPRIGVEGTWPEIDVAGEIDLDCESIDIKDMDLDIENVHGHASFNEGAMVIDVAGGVAGGSFTAAGGMKLSGFTPTNFDLYTDFNDVTIKVMDDVPLGIEGRLALQGGTEGEQKPILSGDVWVTRLRYTKDFKLASVEDIMIMKPSEAVKTYDSKKEHLRLDVVLHGYENLGVANNLVDVRFRIDETQKEFRLVGTDAMPVMLGSVLVTKGTLVWQKKTFEVTRGILDFVNASRTEPHFDVIAVGDVRDWRLTLQAIGTPEDFKVIVSSEPALSDEDIVCLLASDMTCEEAYEGLGFIGAYGLNELLGQFAPIEQFRVVPVFDPESGKAVPMVMVKQKLTEKFSVSALSSLGGNEATGQGAYVRATIAYKVNDNLDIEGFYDTKGVGKGSNVGNLGVDLSWRLEF